MHWIPFAILACVTVLVQATAGNVLTITGTSIGTIGPDFAAMVAVFVALNVRRGVDAMTAGWALGLALDLTAAGGPGGATAVGPMAVAYALAAGGIYRLREAVFRDRALTQGLLVALFCAASHGLWVTVQCLRFREAMTWPDYGRLLLQAAALAAYSGLLTPLVNVALGWCRGALFASPAGRPRRT